LGNPKVLMQGKLFQEYMHLLYCSVMSPGGNVNTRRMSLTAWHGIHLSHKKSMKYFGMWITKIFKIQCFYPPRTLDERWCIYSCLQISSRENWYQYVRRVYETAINFPRIITLGNPVFKAKYFSLEIILSLKEVLF